MKAKPAAHDLAGQFMVCPVCFNAKQLDKDGLLPNAERRAAYRCRSGSGTREQQPSVIE
jgi:hypothetical protein